MDLSSIKDRNREGLAAISQGCHAALLLRAYLARWMSPKTPNSGVGLVIVVVQTHARASCRDYPGVLLLMEAQSRQSPLESEQRGNREEWMFSFPCSAPGSHVWRDCAQADRVSNLRHGRRLSACGAELKAPFFAANQDTIVAGIDVVAPRC